MTPRFYVEDNAIPGRAGIFDRAKGNRLVCFFLHDPENGEAAPAMARVCAKALNAAAAARSEKGGQNAA